jgi:membrane protease YdiL (CAAX protease family)
MQQFFKAFCTILIALTALILIGWQMKLLGFVLLGLGLFSLLFCDKQFRKDIFLVYFCLGLLGITPISTVINFTHVIQMGIPLVLVVFIPYIVSKYVYKDHLVRFNWHHGRSWYKKEIIYILVTCFLAYLILPVMLKSTNSYLNWDISPGWWNITLSYLGLNAVGFWDELFFVSTILGILRRHLSFPVANFTQSVIFTSFLYTLGFQGWSFIVIFIFALVQGYVFKKTESLFYVLTIHLSFDLILHLVLVHLNHPTWIPIFFIK